MALVFILVTNVMMAMKCLMLIPYPPIACARGSQ